jgi:hypothetical protein
VAGLSSPRGPALVAVQHELRPPSRSTRDLVGVPVGGSFQESFGNEGTMFGLPDTTTHMEIVRCECSDARADRFEQTVFHLADDSTLAPALEPLLRAGFTPVAAPHPYWKATGGVVFLHPDGRASSTRPGSSAADPIPSTTHTGRRQSPDRHLGQHRTHRPEQDTSPGAVRMPAGIAGRIGTPAARCDRL